VKCMKVFRKALATGLLCFLSQVSNQSWLGSWVMKVLKYSEYWAVVFLEYFRLARWLRYCWVMAAVSEGVSIIYIMWLGVFNFIGFAVLFKI